MSIEEKTEGMPEENRPRCPKCGSVIRRPDETGPEPAPGTGVCEVCGSPLMQLRPEQLPVGEAHLDQAAPEAVPPAANVPPPAARARNPLALVVVAIVAAGMLFFGFHMARRTDANPGPTITKSGIAPDFTLDTLDGKSMRLSDLRGKAVLLNFWATWCGPCKIETPWLVELQKQYGAQGLQVIGVAMDDSGKDDIAKFAQDMGVNYPVLLGKEAVGDEYGGVPALPESFFIGRDGKIVDRIIGLRGRADIEEAIQKALNTKPATAQAASGTAPLQAQK